VPSEYYDREKAEEILGGAKLVLDKIEVAINAILEKRS